jgi:hypothetical protein
MRTMPGLLEMRLHVATRMREIAAESTDAREIASAQAYADELDLTVFNEQNGFIAGDHSEWRNTARQTLHAA